MLRIHERTDKDNYTVNWLPKNKCTQKEAATKKPKTLEWPRLVVAIVNAKSYLRAYVSQEVDSNAFVIRIA